MNIAQAKLAGLRAQRDGKDRAPALNPEFTEAVYDDETHDTVALLKAFLYGWDMANMAQGEPPGTLYAVRCTSILHDPAAQPET
jgi:hypothetical protein